MSCFFVLFEPSLIRVVHINYLLNTQWRLTRLGGRPGWSESSLGAHVILLVLSCGGSFINVLQENWISVSEISVVYCKNCVSNKVHIMYNFVYNYIMYYCLSLLLPPVNISWQYRPCQTCASGMRDLYQVGCRDGYSVLHSRPTWKLPC